VRSVVLFVALTATAAELRIRVTDEFGKPVWTRLEVHGPDGKMYQAAGSIQDDRPMWRKVSAYPSSFVVNGECKLDLLPAQYKVIAEHGLEYARVERTIVLPEAGLTLPIQMRPWIRMHQRGWYSGDFHVHRPIEDMPALAQAEDVNLSVVFTMWNRRNLWAGKQPPADPVQRVSPRHVLTLMNAEDERAGGAWMFHQIREPLGLEKVVAEGQPTTESWNPPGLDFIRRVRQWRQGAASFPWFDAEKTIWWEVPVVMALEAPDSLGLLNNHFHQYGMLDNEAWGRPRDAQKFPGPAGFADYVLSLYYRYLNLGFRLPPSAGSASGVLPNPVGYNRIYAYIGGEVTPEKWYTAFREQRLFVTNGPMLFWNPQLQGKTLRVNAEIFAREPIDRLEIVANGKVIRKVAARPGATTLRSVLALDVTGHSWVAARCYLKTAGTVRLAHTAPIYLEGKWDAAEDAKFFLQWIDELIAKTAPQPNAEKLHALYRKAREFYAGKASAVAADGSALFQQGLALFQQGLALFNQGRTQEAAELLRRAVAADPSNAEAHKTLGVLFALANDYASAEPHLGKACDLRPDIEDACFYHARALYLLDRYDPAIARLRKLPETPAAGRTNWALAQALEAAGDASAAEAAYKNAVASGYRAGKPDGDTRVLYGVFLFRQGRVEESRQVLEQAVAARPESSRAHTELGRALLDLSRAQDAIAYFKKALALDRSNQAAELLLGKATARLEALR
jgi:tetratricopeptide (TPR) repeat protein